MDKKSWKSLVEKFINKETILYVIFGVLTTVVNLLVFSLFNNILEGVDLNAYPLLSTLFFGKPYLLSNVIAWLAAVIFAFFTNKLFVFESKTFKLRPLLKEMLAFFGARVLSLLIEQLGLYLLIDLLSVGEFVSKLIVSVAVVIINYFLSKLFIFKKN